MLRHIKNSLIKSITYEKLRPENILKTNRDKRSKQYRRDSESLRSFHPNYHSFISKRRVLVLTVFGREQNFPVIEKLYSQKPNLKKLDIIKYIPRGKAIEPLSIIGKYIQPEDICAWLMKEDGKVSIIFGSSQFDMTYAKEYFNDLYNYVLEAIGEYDLTTKIKSVDIQPVNFMSPEVVPLNKFQEGFDNLFK